MLQKNKFTSNGYKSSALSDKVYFALPRVSVLSAAIIYFLSVLFLVLITKLSLASTVEATMVAQETARVSSELSTRVMASVVGLFVAVGFFVASKREAYKLLR